MQQYSRKLSTRIAAVSIAALLNLLLPHTLLLAQKTAQKVVMEKTIMLVNWMGPGAIALPPHGLNWKPVLLTVYDQGTRPVALYEKLDVDLPVSFILFQNPSDQPDEQGCREVALNPILQQNAGLISQRVDGDVQGANGDSWATTTYMQDMKHGGHLQRNFFAFAGNDTTCAEIHISGVAGAADELTAMKQVLAEFYPDLNYQPYPDDYFQMATLLYRGSPELAAPYYRSALNKMPYTAALLPTRRVATDRIIVALKKSGDLNSSRIVAETAIKSDPNYPLNYYTLACADAQQGHAAEAKLHLRQAFDRRAYLPKGQSMPNPVTDKYLLKLKKDRAFWAFVTALPKH